MKLPLIYKHTSIYRNRPDVNAGAPIHAPASIPLSLAEKKYIPVIYHGVVFVAMVLVIIVAISVELRRKMPWQPSSGHGVVIAGRGVKGVFLASVCLEGKARYLLDEHGQSLSPAGQ